MVKKGLTNVPIYQGNGICEESGTEKERVKTPSTALKKIKA